MTSGAPELLALTLHRLQDDRSILSKRAFIGGSIGFTRRTKGVHFVIQCCTRSAFWRAVFGLFFWQALSVVSANDNLNSALKELEAATGTIATATWSADYRKGKIDANGKFVAGSNHARSKCKFEPSTGRYRVESESAINHPDPTVGRWAYREIDAFDGKVVRFVRGERTGTTPPASFEDRVFDAPRSGSVNMDRRQFYTRVGKFSGVAYVWPNCNIGRLTDQIRQAQNEGRRVSLKESAAELQFEIETKTGTTWRVRFDRKRRVVSGYEDLETENMLPFIKMTTEYALNSGHWFPKSVAIAGIYDKVEDRVTFENVVLNAPLEDRDFDLVFPEKTFVTDHVAKTAYVVGGNPKADQETVKSFMKTVGLETIEERTTTFLYINCALLFLIAVLLCNWILRQLWPRAVASVVLCVAIFSAGSSLTQAAANEETQFIPQCGFHVSVFSLEFFGKSYDADEVYSALRPDGVRGISLQSIVQVAQDHQIRTEVRSGVSVKDIRWLVERGWIAIVPVRVAGSCTGMDLSPNAGPANHYFVVVKHPKMGVVVLDIPNSILRLDRTGIADQLKPRSDSVVLFLKRS